MSCAGTAGTFCGRSAGWAAAPHTCPLYTLSSPRPAHPAAQIENPVRVLPMRRFCVGNRTAALSAVRHFSDVQQAIEAGLLAAAAAGQPLGSGELKARADANGGSAQQHSGSVQVGVPLVAPAAAAMTRS